MARQAWLALLAWAQPALAQSPPEAAPMASIDPLDPAEAPEAIVERCVDPVADAIALAVEQAAQALPAEEAGPAGEMPPEIAAQPDTTPLPECPAPPEPPPPPNIFGHAATPVGAKVNHANWDVVRTSSLDGLHGAWDEMLGQAGQLDGDSRIEMVNRWVNWHLRFIEDQGVDRWTDAAATLARGYGDCEDIVIAKMALLARLGMASDDMFVVVVVRDRHRAIDHAVLAVRRDNRMVVLDNRTDRLLGENEIADYVPTLGFSGPFAWVYGYN